MCLWCRSADAAGENPHRREEPALSPFHSRGGSLLRANSGSQAATPGECQPGGVSPSTGAAPGNRGFNILVALHLCGKVAASCLCFSQVNKHFIQGGTLLTNQVVTIPRSWIQGQVFFTVTDMTREPSLLLEILRNRTKQPLIAPLRDPQWGKSILRLLLKQSEPQ